MTDRYATAHAARCSRWPNPHEGGGVPWDRPKAEPEPEPEPADLFTVHPDPISGWHIIGPGIEPGERWFAGEADAIRYAARLNLKDRNPPKAEPELEPAEPELEPAKPWTVQRALVFGWYAVRPDTTQWNLWFPSESAARDYAACLNLKDRNPPTA